MELNELLRQVYTLLGQYLDHDRGQGRPVTIPPMDVEKAEPSSQGDLFDVLLSKEDPFADLSSDEIPGPKHYTDAELIQACKDRQATGTTDGGMPPEAIRAIIYSFSGKGRSVVNIPMNKREAFVNALNDAK